MFTVSAPTLSGYTLVAHWLVGLSLSNASVLDVACNYGQSSPTAEINVLWKTGTTSVSNVKAITFALFVKNDV